MRYVPRRVPELERWRLRGLDFQLYRWPGADRDPIVLVHGWGDSGETFQFLIDQLELDRTAVAFDCRGFGRSEWSSGGYWIPDYLADLEELLDRLAPGRAVDLVGHSMGGNIVMLYAGARSERVKRLVSLEGFGMRRTTADQAPGRYRQWLDELKEEPSFATYDDFEHFARVLAGRNPRTSADRIDFIARSWGRRRGDGRIELRADPRHKLVNPVLYQRDQAEACWRAIDAPVLLVSGTESEFARRYADELSDARVREIFKNATQAIVPGAGHMLHHERPDVVAKLIRDFLLLLPQPQAPSP
jgi:pimeloyl-ACP methyl ester carboxylesterase